MGRRETFLHPALFRPICYKICVLSEPNHKQLIHNQEQEHQLLKTKELWKNTAENGQVLWLQNMWVFF